VVRPQEIQSHVLPLSGAGIEHDRPSAPTVPQMEGVFDGYATIVCLMGVGVLLAHLKVIDAAGQRTLQTLAYFVASPALLVVVLADADLGSLFSGSLVATSAAVVVTGLLYVGTALLRRQRLGDSVIGALCAVYVNAGNLGLPLAAYVLGDVALVAPTLLLQLLVLQPLALGLLDVQRSQASALRTLSRPLTNPITVGSAVGLTLALADRHPPSLIADPLTLVGAMAVPSMLLAYGIGLRLGPLPGRGVAPAELSWIVGLKLVSQPLVAYAVGRFLLDLGAHQLLAVTVLSALPTAQNIFVVANRYGRSTLLARDAIFFSTVLSAPAIGIITWLLI
jgi:malonate transporter and related proteins